MVLAQKLLRAVEAVKKTGFEKQGLAPFGGWERKAHKDKNTREQNVPLIVLGFWGDFVYVFFSPIRNDPKKTWAPTQSGDNPANLFMFMCFFSFPESLWAKKIDCQEKASAEIQGEFPTKTLGGILRGIFWWIFWAFFLVNSNLHLGVPRQEYPRCKDLAFIDCVSLGGSAVRKRVVSKRVILADVPWYQKPE